MNPARAVRTYTGAVFFFWVVCSGLFMAAGGLGLATSVGFIGLMWAPMLLWPAMQALRARPPAMLAGLAVIAFAVLSLAWSPYDRPDQAIKLALLTPLYALVPYGITRLDTARRLRFAAFIAIITGLVAAYFLIESLLGAPLAQWAKEAEGIPAGPEALALARRTLSRGASAFILLTGPMTIWLWFSGRRIPAIILALIAGLSAVSFDVDANIAALVAGAVLGVAAYLRPRLALPGLLYAIAALVALTPLLLGAAVAWTPEELVNALPLSWHQRLEIWAYALGRLAEAPLFGLGLDASRTMNDEMILRGHVLNLIPLHPHNGGLHIWLETGATGAGLVTAALVLAGRSLARRPPAPSVAAGLAFSVAAWVTLTTLGYGVWQEWHHAALSLAVAASLFARPDDRPRAVKPQTRRS